MGILASFTDMLPVDVILASSDESEIPRPRKPKKDSGSRSKQDGTVCNRVLVIGRQRELALYRAEFLRLAGFIVLIAADVDEAIRIMQRGAFDAIVLSYTLPSRDVQYLADAARDYCSECAVIAISNSNTVDPRVQPDALVLADEGPAGLVSALKRIL